MPSTGKKKTTTKKKTQTRSRAAAARKKTAGRKKTQKAPDNGMRSEILLLLVLALSLLLLISNFDLGGTVGNRVSGFFFGLFGILSYVFPLVLFFTTAFAIANKKNPLIGRKIVGVVLAYWVLEGFFQLFLVGYAKGDTLKGYFAYCQAHKTGGGLFGGLLSKALCTAFGLIGAYILFVIAFVIALIIITQKPLLAPIRKTGEKVYQGAKVNHQRRVEKRRTIAFDQMKVGEEKAAVPAEHKEAVPKPKKVMPEQKEDSGVNEPPLPQLHIVRNEPVLSDEEVFNPPVSCEDEGQKEPPSRLMTDATDPAAREGQPEERQEEKTGEPSSKSRKNPRSSKKEIAEGIQSIQSEMKEKEAKEKAEYTFPPLTLLKPGDRRSLGDSDAHLRETASKLQNTLHNFGVNVTITNVSCGPTVTRYELQPEQGVKVSRIVSLTDDIKLNLAAADIRIEAPIPGKAAVGIEVPNKTNSAVKLRDLLDSDEFQKFPSKLAFAVGKDIAGKTVVADIAKMPHLLIAGATGSGKSVCINTLIMSILYKAKPEEVKLIMIDPKVVELSVYNGIPHLFIPVVTDPKKAAGALNWAVSEMTDRYNKFAEANVRDLKGYNAKVEELADIEDENKPKKLPQIVIIVDELADLMMVAPGEVEDAICRLAQLARAAGLHLIIATQRPSVNVITGLIKANMPSRIAFSVSSGVDSRTILDMNGAEKLLGKGDMLYYPQGYQKPARLQGSFVSDEEVADVVSYLTSQQGEDSYDTSIEEMMSTQAAAGLSQQGGAEDRDTYFVEAGKFIIEKDKASIGMLQRMFKIGFNRAARIMDQLSDAGVVGPEEGTKPRKVLMSMEQFENYIEESL